MASGLTAYRCGVFLLSRTDRVPLQHLLRSWVDKAYLTRIRLKSRGRNRLSHDILLSGRFFRWCLVANPERPWFPFYARDWLTDVQVMAMPMECQGAYLRLLCLQWENGSVPEQARDLAAILGYESIDSGVHFQATVWPMIIRHFPVIEAGEQRANTRLENIRNVAEKKKKHLSSAGKKGRRKQLEEQSLVGVARTRPRQTSESESESDEEKKETHPQSRTDWGAMAECWNQIAKKHRRPTIKKLTDTRKRKLAARLREFPNFFTEVDAELALAGSIVHEGAWLTFDWLLSPANLTKLLEGNYRKRGAPGEDEDQPEFDVQAAIEKAEREGRIPKRKRS